MSENIFDEVINRKGTYSTQWDYVEDRFGEKDLLPFTISDTDFSVPNKVMEKLKERMNHPVFGYTRWNHFDYKSSIVEWFNKRLNTVVDYNWIIYSPSVMYSVSKLIEMHTSPGDGVIIQTPSYDAFFKTINASKRKLIKNPLKYIDGKYELDFQDLESKLSIDSTKILLICSPHNPTGRVWTEEELKKIVELCQKYNVFLISDEIHMDVLREGIIHNPIIKYIGSYNKVAICTSASKTFNIPGLGGSYLLLLDRKIRKEFQLILKNRDGLSSANIFGITATMAAYNHGSDWVNQLNNYINENLQYVKAYIEKELPELTFEIPESTYLAWIDIQDLPFTMQELQDTLVSKGKVAIMDGKTYGGNGTSFLRLNVGCPRDKLIEGLDRLKKSVDYLYSNM